MRFLPDGKYETPPKCSEIEELLALAISKSGGILHEHEVYKILGFIGIEAPPHYFHNSNDPTQDLTKRLPGPWPFVAKAIIQDTTHKTDINALEFNVTVQKAQEIVKKFQERFASSPLEGVLFVTQINHFIQLGGEMLIGLYQDPFFGPCVSLGFGGTATEYYKKIMRPQFSQIYIPADVDLASVEHLLKNIPIVQMIEGKIRGLKQSLTYNEVIQALIQFQKLGRYFSLSNQKTNYIIEEIEINPATAHNHKLMALDGVISVREKDGIKTATKPLTKIKNLISPSSIAIAGASGKNPANPANIILKKLLKSGKSREQLYLIHPKEDAIEGISCVKDVSELLKKRNGIPVDCLVVGVTAKVAGSIIYEAFDTRCAHSIQIISAGFGETASGEAMQKELTAKLNSLNLNKRPVVNGPNTLGNIYHNTDTLFTAQYKSSGTGIGKKNAALICQSGAFMITRISDLADVIAPAISVSVGNQMDLSVTDFFEYLLNEKDIVTYGLYIEGLNPDDGIRLMHLIETAQEKSNFTVIYKAGRTEAGIEAAKGHTAAMAGDYDMFVHLMRCAGGLVADTFTEFQNLLMVTSYCDGLAKLKDIPKGKLGIAALSNAGFEKCAIADHLTAISPKTFEIAKYTKETKDKLQTIFNEHGLTGIMDIHDVLDLTPMMNDEGFEKIIRATLEDKNVHFGIYAMVPETVQLNTCLPSDRHKEDVAREGSILNRLIRIKKDIDKPFVISFESGSQYTHFRNELLKAGIPVFAHADDAARTVAKVIDAIRCDVD